MKLVEAKIAKIRGFKSIFLSLNKLNLLYKSNVVLLKFKIIRLSFKTSKSQISNLKSEVKKW